MTALLSHSNAVPDLTLAVPVPFATISGTSFEIRSTYFRAEKKQ